jgi:hypothetical protein
MGRFISEDPIGLDGGINPYVYAGNNPMNWRDPTGLDCKKRDSRGVCIEYELDATTVEAPAEPPPEAVIVAWNQMGRSGNSGVGQDYSSRFYGGGIRFVAPVPVAPVPAEPSEKCTEFTAYAYPLIWGLWTDIQWQLNGPVTYRLHAEPLDDTMLQGQVRFVGASGDWETQRFGQDAMFTTNNSVQVISVRFRGIPAGRAVEGEICP